MRKVISTRGDPVRACLRGTVELMETTIPYVPTFRQVLSGTGVLSCVQTAEAWSV